jgi:hypothetical protein
VPRTGRNGNMYTRLCTKNRTKGWSQKLYTARRVIKPVRQKTWSSRRILDLSEASIAGHTGLGRARGTGTRNVLSGEVGEEARVGPLVAGGASVGIQLASMAQIRCAGGIGSAVWAREDLAGDGAAGVNNVDDVLEDISLGDDHGASVDLEGVATVGVPVVVDGVQQRVAGDLGRASRRVVNVVALHGH